MPERPPPWEDLGTSEGWSDEDRLQAARQMFAFLDVQDRRAQELGLTRAQLEALQMIQEHGHRQAYKAAKHLAQVGGSIVRSGDADRHFQEVLEVVRAYRQQLPRWRRVLGV